MSLIIVLLVDNPAALEQPSEHYWLHLDHQQVDALHSGDNFAGGPLYHARRVIWPCKIAKAQMCQLWLHPDAHAPETDSE